MAIKETIDGGKAFDWGRTSADYAKYRDIYPPEFYEYLINHGIGEKGQDVLDLGTGTGVLPRNLYRGGARFTGMDSSENQVIQARELAREGGMDIRFLCAPAEEIDFPDGSFHVVTACQCFFYFDHPVLAPKISRVLKEGGRLVVLYMAWLPFEDKIAGQSESLILKYNPSWSGCGETRRPISIAPEYLQAFELESSDVFDLAVSFTRETWDGRIRACRGVGASLPERELAEFQREHKALLERIAPERFAVQHYAAAAILKKK